MLESRGLSLVEGLATLAVAALVLAVALPAAALLRDGGRLAAGTRELALTMQATRWKSVSQRRGHGMLFVHEESGWSWYLVRDGNGNGLRSAELAAGVDRRLSGPHRLGARVAGVTLGLPEGPIPAIPPRTGTLNGTTEDPIRFGRSDLISFGPLGTSSSGTLFVTDGAGSLAAVTLFGPTARVRTWRFDRRRGAWRR